MGLCCFLFHGLTPLAGASHEALSGGLAVT